MKANDNKRIVAVGVGGAGARMIDRIIANRTEGVEFIAVDTDWQSLKLCRACKRLYIGRRDTKGTEISTVTDSVRGEEAALLHAGEISEVLDGAAMVFILCGLGGSIGSSAAWVVAKLAKEQGIFTAAIVTRPFAFEDAIRLTNAKQGFRHIEEEADSVTVIPNDSALRGAKWEDSIWEALKKTDEIIAQMVGQIARFRNQVGLIILTLQDLQWIMKGAGPTYIGIGESGAEDLIKEAVPKAVQSVWQDIRICGADRALVFIEGDISLMDLQEASIHIESLAGEDAEVFLGLNWMQSDRCMVMVIASGIEKYQTSRLWGRDV